MVRLFLIAILASCGRSQGVPDQDLGNLVIAPKEVELKIDVDRAAKDPAELGRALMRPYRAAIAAIGPHALGVQMTTDVSEGNTTLTEKYQLDLGDADAWHGTYTNSQDYGRETIFANKQLYLRPRYQRWHVRGEESPGEALALRDGFASALGATWELFGFAAELTDKGAAGVNGRAGRKIEVKLAPSPAKAPAETLTQRKWRESRSVDALTGEVILDADKGVPLAVTLNGQLSFVREGKKLTMKVQLASNIGSVGPVAIAAPAAGDAIATPERLKEVDERDQLLDGFAPPQKVQKK